MRHLLFSNYACPKDVLSISVLMKVRGSGSVVRRNAQAIEVGHNTSVDRTHDETILSQGECNGLSSRRCFRHLLPLALVGLCLTPYSQ